LVTKSADKVFKGAIGSYGKIKDAPAFVAFIGKMESPHVQEEVGYTGEGIILEATALQLDTCWVAGFFKPELAASLAGAGENERVLAVTPVGYAKEFESLEEKLMTGFGVTHRRKPLSNLATGLKAPEWSDWMRVALEAARLAPSAVNRQPWRFLVQKDSITISVDSLGLDFSVSKRLDCGIAMLHIEVAALNFGVQGKWELLDSPLVARFTIRCNE